MTMDTATPQDKTSTDESLDASAQIALFKDFFEKNHYAELLEKIRKGEKFMVVDFFQLTRFSPEMADLLLDQPEEVIKGAEIALEHIDEKSKGFAVRIKNLPSSSKLMIGNIRSVNLTKFYLFEGVVRIKSEVRPQVTSARFECPSCGNVLSILQLDTKFKEPQRCSCGRKGKFRLLNKELVDAQSLTLEEVPELLDGGEQPKRINVLLKNDLVSPFSEKKTSPGSRVGVIGIIKEIPIMLRSGGQSTKFDIIIDANHVESVQEDFIDISISEEEKKQILELSTDPHLMKKMVQSLAPSIYGHEKIKEALVLQLMGGVRKKRDDGVVTRGDMHMLLVGDPGAAKCLSGETNVVLNDGSQKQIKEIVEPILGGENKKDVSSLNIFVPSFNSKGHIGKSKVLAVSKRTVNKITNIKTNQGSHIRTSTNHPFFVIKDGLIIPKSAKDLSKEDFVAVPRIICCETSLQSLPQKINRVKSHNAKHITLPPYCTEEMARFLGYLVGDGYCAYTKTSGWATLTGNDEKLLDDFSLIVKKLFSLNTTRRNSHKGKTALEVYASSKELISFLELISPEILQGARKKTVPECILKSPLNIVASFIRALFDCDGTVRKNKREVSLTSANPKLIEQIRLLLKRFGISSQVHTKYQGATNSPTKKKDYYYQLYISGESAVLFSDYIGFSLKRKQEKIQTETSKPNPNLAVIPNIGNVMKKLRVNLGISQFETGVPHTTYQHYERGDRNPTYSSLSKIVAAFENTIKSIYSTPPLALQIPEEISMNFTILKLLSESQISWEKISDIQIQSVTETVYDLEVKETHNFIANGFIVHNSQMLKRISIISPRSKYITGKSASAAGLSATVVRDEILQGWSLEAGALVLANKGICCTTEDSEFILEDGTKMTFKELFKAENSAIIQPKFKVFGLNTETNKIQPFSIKKAFVIKNTKKVYEIITRTGRKLKLTEDNKILTSKDSSLSWIPVGTLDVNSYIGVPKRIIIHRTDGYNAEFAYICGLLASDGHISLNERRGGARLYNTQPEIINKFKKMMVSIGNSCSVISTPAGRLSRFDGQDIISKKTLFCAYNSTKEFARKCIEFGVPAGNKSTINPLSNKILTYSDTTIAHFLRGIFDGDGSIRFNPTEITLTTGIEKNARLFQELLLRFGIVSSVKKSTRSWHCEIRGANYVLTFYRKIGTIHPQKRARLKAVAAKELKDRIDVLPHHQKFFKQLIQKYRWKLGKPAFRYFWNYAREGVTPSLLQLEKLNTYVNDVHLYQYTASEILWDKIISKREVEAEYVYDFTMEGTNNFIANGIIMHNCIDELDKMSKEDSWALHEALEQQSISISKANIQATLRCETTVLAAANPKWGRFDPYDTVANQIDLPPTLINRFDLIFPIKDLPDITKDEKMASFILELHKNNSEKPAIETKLLRKYFAYARQLIFPKLTDAAIEELKNYYIKMRGSATGEGIKSIPISARQLEGLVRLSEASARLKLSDKVLKQDAEKAIELLDYCLRQVAYDEKTGTIDIDRIATEMPATQRNKIILIKEIIVELENALGKNIPVEEIFKKSEEKGLSETEVEEVLQKLKRAGDIFEPKKGFISKI